jgi:hypothetical protein
VVQNPGLLVRIERAVVDRSPARIPSIVPPDPPALGEGLLLRDDAGTLISAGEMVTLETLRPYGVARPPADSQVEITTRPLALSALTHYEVLSRVAACGPADDDIRVACLQEEFVVLGDFTTGMELDREGPSIASVELGPSLGECLAALTVVASDDHAAPGALRFGMSTIGFLGPNPVLPTPAPTDATRRVMLSVVPIDPSNNRGAATLLEVEACGLLVPDDDINFSLPSAPETQTGPAPQAVKGESGCAFTPGSSSASLGTGAGLFALAVMLVRRASRRAPADV